MRDLFFAFSWIYNWHTSLCKVYIAWWLDLHVLWKYYCSMFSSVAQLCPNLCDPMNRSTPGLPVHHQLPEFTQTHGHQVGDAIQPSHSLSSPSPPALNLSQHQGLFQWVNSSHQVAKVVELQLQNQSFWKRLRIPAGHTHWENQKGKRHKYPNVHRSTVYNSQDMEAT